MVGVITVNGFLFGKFKLFCVLTRAYSLPISIMSWSVPFFYALFKGGNMFYGLISLIGIIVLHLSVNLFDDIFDYLRELKDINAGKKQHFNFQKGKCICIIENKITLKQAVFINLILFSTALLTACFFLYIFGIKLLYIIIPASFLCILYPVLGCLGFGEIIVALIFSPLLYTGVYFVMTSYFSFDILLLSISTGILSVAVLFNHSLLDYKYDTTNRKITLCRICSSEKNALILLAVIVSLSYINLLFWILNSKLDIIYILPLLTLPQAVKLIKEMTLYIKQDKVPDNSKIFLEKFMLAQNLQKYFIIMLCCSIILAGWFI